MSVSPAAAAEANVIIKGTDSGGSARGPNSNKSLLTKQLPGELMQFFHWMVIQPYAILLFRIKQLATLRSRDFQMCGFIL